MSIYVCPPTPQTVEGFANKIDTAWKVVLCESSQDERARNAEVSTSTRVFPELSLQANYGRPWLALKHESGTTLQNGSTIQTASSQPRGRASKPSHQRKGCVKKSYSEPPPAMVNPSGDREHRPGGLLHGVRDGSHNTGAHQGKQQHTSSRDCDEETPDGDLSESSLSADDGGHRKKRPVEFGRSQKASSMPGATLESSSQKTSLGAHKARPMMTTSAARTMSTSKSESYLARTKSGVRLPTVKSSTNVVASSNKTPKRRGRLRELRLPPPGGYQNAAGNGLMKEIEAQIQDLRASPRARRALEARVWHHLSKRSKRYGRHRCRGRRRPLDDSSVCSNDSAGSVGSNSSVEVRAGGAEGQPDDCSGWQERSMSTTVPRGDAASTQHGRGGSASRKPVEQASVSERVAAQTLHAQEVLRRRRAIEEERSKQARERSAFLKEEARRPRDKRAEKKRAETLMTIVACAIGFAEWKARFEDKKAAIRQAELEEIGARSLQRVWRMNRVRRTLALVRASKPAVRSIVFSMRMKAAAAKKVVARRHRTQAADLIHVALRAGTRTLFRTRISYYIERIVKCQRLFTSYREVTKARKRVLTNKWTRHVHKLDERRFNMYSAHLRDMYNFDPAAVEQFLKEMRLLSAQGQTAAQAMKSKLIPPPGVVATNAHASGDDDSDERNGNDDAGDADAGLPSGGRAAAAAEAAEAAENEVDRKREGGAGSPTAGVVQPRGSHRQKRGSGEGDSGAARSRTTAVSGNAPKRARVKLAAGWQKRVVHVHSDVEAQASLMCRRGVKHKEISRALRSVLINDLLNCARREHRNWCWSHVRAAREKERQTAVVNMADIRSVLRTDSHTSDEDEGHGLLEAKIRAQTAQDKGYLPYNRLEYMQLMNMITDDVLMRFIILAERIEGCVAADGSGRGSLSPEELREIFVVNRHPNQHENAAAKEAKAELQAWAKGRGLTLPAMRRGSTSKAASYHLHQKALKEQQSEKARQVPYFDFMSAVKGGILMDICVPEGQRLAVVEQPHPMSVPKISSHRHA